MALEEKQKINTLFASHESYRSIGKKLGKAPNTIKYYLKSSPAIMEEVKEKEQEVADMFEDVARLSLGSITIKNIEASSMLQRVTAAGIAVDKFQLLRGKPTAINVGVLLDVLEAIRSKDRNAF